MPTKVVGSPYSIKNYKVNFLILKMDILLSLKGVLRATINFV
jgi:hypothetical protein